MSERVESMNAKPSMFQAGISNKFTKRHVDNFHDTALAAASAAKQRAERKMEKQAEAIDKQQKKIETEVRQHWSTGLVAPMKKIEEITQQLHRQQVRAAKRLRNRLHFAATRVQNAFRRIPAVVRGFLIRRRLQWVAAVDVDGICKFQALARGFLTRQRLHHRFWELHNGGDARDDDSRFKVDHSGVDGQKESERPTSTSSSLASVVGQPDNRAARDGEYKRVRAIKAAATPPPPTEPITKRSYWLPAGSSFSKRMPVLPAKQRAPVVDFDTDDDDGIVHSLSSDLVNSRSSRTPKKRNRRNRPSRLAPVSPPVSGGGGGVATPARSLSEAETELQHVNQALEEKLRRQEELKHKLLCRKAQEKRRMEHEQKLKRELESEENERIAMAREDPSGDSKFKSCCVYH